MSVLSVIFDSFLDKKEKYKLIANVSGHTGTYVFGIYFFMQDLLEFTNCINISSYPHSHPHHHLQDTGIYLKIYRKFSINLKKIRPCSCWLKEEVRNIIVNVNSIANTIDEIRDGKKDIFNGLFDIVEKIEQGADNNYSIIDKSYTLKESVFELVESLSKAMEGVADGLAGKAKEMLDEIGGGLPGVGK